MIKKYVFFDFDSTLFLSPLPEEGKKIWKAKTGTDYPHLGWWGRKESLDTSVFDIQPKPDIYKHYLAYKDNPSVKMILLTNRQKKLEPYVMGVLQKYNIQLDDYLMKFDNRKKAQRIEDYMLGQNNIEIEYYDDDIAALIEADRLKAKGYNINTFQSV